tara:strand:- start:2502 stop:2783 length:282 start_codon:yes stop_codon:yes gene_type:complete
MIYYAVAFSKFGDFIEKFGPSFESEKAGWEWLHSPGIKTPPHDRIQVLEHFEYMSKLEEADHRQQELAAEEHFAEQASLLEVVEAEDPDLLPF